MCMAHLDKLIVIGAYIVYIYNILSFVRSSLYTVALSPLVAHTTHCISWAHKSTSYFFIFFFLIITRVRTVIIIFM